MKLASEKRWVLGFAVVLMLLTTIPYILAYANQGSELRFTGALLGVEDGNSYIAKMLDGSVGAWLFRTPYTTYPQKGLFAFLPYLLLGKLAGAPGRHEQLVALFHLFRFIAGVFSILATYDFLSIFLKKESNRRIGTVLAAAGGGLGWLLVLAGQSSWLGSLPLDIYSPETFGFLELYALPHLAFARACLLWGLAAYLRNDPVPSVACWKRPAVLGGVLFLIAGFMQPLTALIGWVIIGTHLLITGLWQRFHNHGSIVGSESMLKPLFLNGLGMILISSPIVLYTAVSALTDPFLQAWTSQNVIRSPHLVHYFLAYGLVLPFAIIGGYHLYRTSQVKGLFLAGWILIFPVLAYAPVDIQRRLPEGVWVAWAALALAAFESPQAEPKRRWRYLFALAFPTTLILILGGCLAALNPRFPLFRPAGEIAAFDFLGEQAPSDSVTLAAYDTANALPAWAGVRVVVGHGPESIHKPDLLQEVGSFYRQGSGDISRLAFLKTYDIQYVFWGPFERQLGDWDPAQAGYLSPVYDSGGYAVYRVDLGVFP